MVVNLFKKRARKDLDTKFSTFAEQLLNAFSKIKLDISNLNTNLTQNQQNLHNLALWIQFLHQNQQKVSYSNSDLVKNQENLHQKHVKLHSSHHEAVKKFENDLDRLQIHKISTDKDISSVKLNMNQLSEYLESQKNQERAFKQELGVIEEAAQDAIIISKKLISGLKTENIELKERLENLSKNLENTKISMKSHISDTKSETLEHHNKKFQEHHSRFNEYEDRLKSHEEAINELKSVKKEESENLTSIKQHQQAINMPILTPSIQSTLSSQMPQSNFEKHIVSRMRPNRKSYVIQFILNLISESRYSTKDLEEIIVNEKQLCGRTSFYAYLKELKIRNKINYAEVDNRTILVKID